MRKAGILCQEADKLEFAKKLLAAGIPVPKPSSGLIAKATKAESN
jgi:hypothetical protein